MQSHAALRVESICLFPNGVCKLLPSLTHCPNLAVNLDICVFSSGVNTTDLRHKERRQKGAGHKVRGDVNLQSALTFSCFGKYYVIKETNLSGEYLVNS